MALYRLAFLGFGNVGRALARLLLQKQNELASRYDIKFLTTGIATGKHGAAINPVGIDLDAALKSIESGENLQRLSVETPPVDNLDFIKRCQADVLFENTPVNHTNGQPAIEHIRLALETNMHVATANKGPIVHAYQELMELANAREHHFLFESTVMDGAPIFSLFRSALPGAQLISFRGVLNSTTNLILTRMETGESFDEAIKYAQSIGIAETDPSGDVDGWDAAIKVAALVTVLMGIPLKPQEVKRQGIGNLTSAEIISAKTEGKRWKLVCSAHRKTNSVIAEVAPKLVSASSTLYNIEGTTSIIEFETDVLGLLSLQESNPGPETTAYGLLADFINAVKQG